VYYLNKYAQLFLLIGIMIWANPLFAEVDLSISTEPPSNEVVVGNGLNYVLNVKNTGPEAITNVQIRYTFSPAMDIGVITGGTCAEGTCTLDELGAKDTATDTATITIPITVPNTVLDVGSDKITLTVSDVADADNTVADGNVSILKPDLSVSVAPSSDKALAGQGLSYELGITNNGTGAASGVTVQYEFPDIADMVIGEITGAGWACDAATCNLTGNLDAGVTSNMTLPVTTPDAATGQLKIVATVNGTNEPTGETKPDESVTIFPAEANLSITQTVSDEAIVKDGNVRYNLVVNNAGPSAADNVSVTIVLVGSSEYVAAIGDWNCSNAGQTVTCDLASLANGATSAFSIDVQGKSGSISNNATVISAALDPDDTDNRSSSQNVVVFTYDVSPDTEVAPDTIMLKANSAVEGITFCWNSGDKWAVGEDTSIDIESDGVSYLSLSVNNGEIGANCEIGGAREIKRINNIMVTLEPNTPPAAYLEVTPQSLAAPGSVNLDASNSTDSRNEQSGSGISGYQFSHNGVMIPADGSWLNSGVYNLDNVGVGFHTFTVFVKDKKGATSTATSQVIVGDSDIPLADFNFTADRMEAPAAITLNAETNDAITSYEFTVINPNGSPINFKSDLTDPNVKVTFPIIGNYRVSLKVTNARGEFSETSRDIYIGSTGIPIVYARVSPTKGQQPHIVRLTPSFLDPDGQPYKSCVWTIKDLNKTIVKNCDEIETYTFSEVGQFAVELKAFDVEDEFGIDSKVVEVYAPGTPVPTVDIMPIKGFSPLTVTAVASAIDPNPMDEVDFLWNSPNGAISEPQKERTEIQFTGVGEYDVTVTAKDDSIAELSATSPERKVTVVAVPQITTNATVGCKTLIVNFGIDSNPDTDYFQYNWSSDKGQPESANEASTNITFQVNESAVVTLKVTDNTGTENGTKVITKTVSTVCDNVDPISNMAFVTQAVKGFAPFTVTVKDQGSYDPDNTRDPLLFRWKADTAHTIESPTAAETAIIFSSIGTHNIVLEVSDSIATDDSAPKTIEVIAPPQITASATEVCQSTSVSLSVPQEQGFSYLWSSASLPDVSSTAANWTVTFEQSSMVNLQVTDGNGTSVNVTKQITVLPALSELCTDPVQAVIIPVPSQIWVNQSVSVDGSTSTGPIVSYDWLTSDSQTCASKTCSFTFANAGNYKITLKVSGDSGIPSSVTVSVDVIPIVTKPVQAVIIPVPSQIQVNESLSVDGSTSTGPIVSYDWLTSDGQTCSSKTCPFTFANVGNYNITLKVNGDGVNPSSATVSVEVVAEPIPIKAVIVQVPSQIQVNESLSVDGSTSTGPIVSYAWLTSDGQTCTSKKCDFTFTSVGTKNITLTVSGESGTSSTTVSVEVVAEPIPIKAVINPVPSQIQVNESLSVNGSTSTGPIVSYAWSTSDGQTCASKMCDFTFASAGTKNITLTVSGDGGITNNAIASVTVVEPTPDPMVDLKVVESAKVGDKVKFDGSGSTGPFGMGYRWFIDGSPLDCVRSMCFNTFNEVGDFKIELEIYTQDASASASNTITIEPAPIIDILVVPVVGVASENLHPSDGSKPILTLDAGDDPNIIEHKWTIRDKDNQVVDEQYGSKPTLSFDDPGEFTVELVVKGKNGIDSEPVVVKSVNVPAQIPPEVPDVETTSENLAPSDGTKPILALDAGDHPSIAKYKWAVRDASGQVVDEQSGSKPTFSFDKQGVFTVDLVVEGKNGKVSEPKVVKTVTVPNIVTPPPPPPTQPKIPVVGIDNIEFVPDGDGKAIKKVTLNAGENPEIIEYKWTVTDASGNPVGEPQYGPYPTLSFDEPGDFTVALTTKDKDNDIAGPKDVVKVKGPSLPPVIPEVDIIADELDADGNKKVTLGVVGDNPDVEYEWKTSDGRQKASGKTPEFEFDEPGEYFVDLTVKNKGNGAFTTAKKKVKIIAPQGTISMMDPSSGDYEYGEDDPDGNNTSVLREPKGNPGGDNSSILKEPNGTGGDNSSVIKEPKGNPEENNAVNKPEGDNTEGDNTNPTDVAEPDNVNNSQGGDNTVIPPVQKGERLPEVLSFQLNRDELSPGENLEVKLNINFHDGIVGCPNADLWVAIMLPEEFRTTLNISTKLLPLLFFHKGEGGNVVWTYHSSVEPAPPAPQKYGELSEPLQDSWTLLNYNIPNEGLPVGDYVFYSGLFKSDTKPLLELDSAFCTDSGGNILSETTVKILK